MKRREQDELLTVQEFAEKAGISVQAVYKRLNNSLNSYVKLVNGRKMLRVSALYEVYGVNVEQPIKPCIQPGLNHETDNSEVIFLRKQVEQLQAELSKERQHSRALAERVVVLADQAQRLQLAQMSPQFIDEGGAADLAETEPISQVQQSELEQPKNWWSRIFRRHR
ncbi:hypothetical protein [Agathobaculum desmolans]|uniref:hypothetical protein n=1 Tax=Agathobaculum desmolans TaxID=39484 RepID=UPI0004E0FFE0|nr:hypothetical protein [Agathobaculum desmolans]